MPKVSVCVVTYNQEPYIGACLASVLAQEIDAEVEILVGDDDSTDRTPQILAALSAAHPGRIRLFGGERRGGSWNYRRLIEAATGDFIAHLDGDDYWLPGKLALQLSRLQADPSATGVYSNALVCDPKGHMIGAFNNAQPERFDMAYLLERGNFLCHSTLFYRASEKRCLLELDYPCLDYGFHLALAGRGPLLYANQALACYLAGSPTSVLRGINESVRDRYWKMLVTGLAPPLPAATRERALGDFLRRVLFRSASTRDPGLFGRWWRTVSGISPRGRARLSVALFVATARESIRLMRQWLGGRLSGNRCIVLYYR